MKNEKIKVYKWDDMVWNCGQGTKNKLLQEVFTVSNKCILKSKNKPDFGT